MNTRLLPLWRTAFLCCLGLGLAACDSAEDAGPPTVVEGTVTYQGQPLPDMGVGIRGTLGSVVRPLLDEDITDSNGRFRLEEFLETGGVLELTGWDPSRPPPTASPCYYYFPNTAERFFERGRHYEVEVAFELGGC